MTIVLIVVLLIVALLLFAATRPNDFRTARSLRIGAPPERISSILSDFRQWAPWSPWEKRDPALQRSFSGASTGKGSIYEWTGNKHVGQGRMEILESSPATVRIDLQFIKPFQARNSAIFTLEPAGDGTDVTWAMEGTRPFMLKLMGVFMNMDKIVGRDFETGLASLKSIAEK